MPPRKKPQAKPKQLVANADGMLDLPFRQHCQLRHPRLGFWSRGKHFADHKMRSEFLDHTHAEKQEEAGMEPDKDV